MLDVMGRGLGCVVGPGVHVGTGGDLTLERLVGVGVVCARGYHVIQQRFQGLGHHGLDGQHADGHFNPQHPVDNAGAVASGGYQYTAGSGVTVLVAGGAGLDFRYPELVTILNLGVGYTWRR